MVDVKYIRIRDVKRPEIGHIQQDAGIDFFIPRFNNEFIELLKNKCQLNSYKLQNNDIIINPHCRVLIPSGIKINIPKSTALIAANKSGIANKKGLIFGSQVIDYNYQGQIHISLINTNNYPITISEDDKIIQFILTPIIYSHLIQCANQSQIFQKVSQRGNGGFGSTNDK